MATAEQFLKQAAKYIGVSGTDNIFNTWYYGHHVYDANLYPWCAGFQSYVGVHDLKMPFKASVSASGVARQGTRVADKDVKPGDWVLFNWNGRQTWDWADHIGVVEWFDHKTGYFGTIEGNTGTVAGGTVARVTRNNNANYATSFWRPPYDKKATTPTPSKAGNMVGIDISSHQEGINLSKIAADFVIVKATGGTWYKNPFWKKWVDEVLKSGKPLGIYHYAVEGRLGSSAKAEARYFIDTVKAYKGKFIPILDWEADAMSLPVSWAKEWLDIVAKELGATPWFYAYASHVNSRDYSAIAAKYPLWMASYLPKYYGSGFLRNPDQTWKTGSWKKLVAYQYASQGRVAGYSKNLDLSVFYGNKDDWKKYQSTTVIPSTKPVTTPSKPATTAKPTLKFRLKQGGKWLKEGDVGAKNKKIQAIALDMPGWYQVKTRKYGWLPKVTGYNINDHDNGYAGYNDDDILAVRAFYKTQNPSKTGYYAIYYRVSVVNKNGYYDWQVDDDVKPGMDGYAGDAVNAIDQFQAKLVKV